MKKMHLKCSATLYLIASVANRLFFPFLLYTFCFPTQQVSALNTIILT